MKKNKIIFSAMILSGTMGLTAGPVWSQDAPGGKAPGRDLPDAAQPMPGNQTGRQSESAEQIKAVQQALKQKGHDPGAINGVMGPQTLQALRSFQQSNGLKPTGVLDSETVQKLGISSSSRQSGER